jgi:hypothetical protein
MAYARNGSATIAAAKCATAAQTNFPALIVITLDHTLMRSDGYDITWYSDSARTTKIAVEREAYNSSTGVYIAWLLIGTLPSTTGSDLTVYFAYGDASISTDPNTDGTYGATSVWDANYKGVWHLPNGTTLTANDSTVNGNNGTLSATPPVATVDGKIDGAASFDGTHNDITSTGLASVFDSSIDHEGTISIFFNSTSWISPQTYPALFMAYGNGYNQILIGRHPSYGLRYLHVAGGTTQEIDITTPSTGAWHKATFSWSATNNQIKAYLDGVQQGSTLPGPITKTWSIDSISVGGTAGQDPITYYYSDFVGSLDELRISSIARSADWIADEFANQNDQVIGTGHFWSASTDEAAAAGISISIPAASMAFTGKAPTGVATDYKTVSVPVGSTLFTGKVPTSAVSDNKNISVPKGAAALTGYVPGVSLPVGVSIPTANAAIAGKVPTTALSDHKTIAVPMGSTLITGQAPTAVASDHKTVAVPAGSEAITGKAPTAVATNLKNISVPAQSLAITGKVPTIAATAHQSIAVPVGAMVYAGLTPTVSVTGSVAIGIPTAAMAYTAYVPTVVAGGSANINVPTQAMSIAGYAPTILATANKSISVPAGALALLGYAPGVALPVGISVPAASMIITGRMPTAGVSANLNIPVPKGILALTGFAPTPAATGNQYLSVPLGSLSITGRVPVAASSGATIIDIPVGTMLLTGHAPELKGYGISWWRTCAPAYLYGADPRAVKLAGADPRAVKLAGADPRAVKLVGE